MKTPRNFSPRAAKAQSNQTQPHTAETHANGSRSGQPVATAIGGPANGELVHTNFASFGIEQLEDRYLLSAILPVFVDGEFSFGDPTQDAPYGLENTFKLASRPSATKTIFLDFDGFHSVDNAWGHDIVFPAFDRDGDPSSFSDSELIEIQRQFQTVAEDFMPFNVNVTTIDPGSEALINSGGADEEWGIRSLATQATDGFGNGIGGVAFLNSFNWDEDTPAFTFNKGIRNGGMTHSHEVGHTLGLRHDGLGGQTYHPGSGSGSTSWGPIMGAPFGKEIVHWSEGDYPNSTNTEDDLEMITTLNGFGFSPDDHGDALATPTELTIENDTEASGWGVVHGRNDVDVFSFETGEGNINFQINPFVENPNLDIEVTLFDSNGDTIMVVNPADDASATINTNVAAGEYFIQIDGIGKPGVYSDYGSLGFYSIAGNIETPVEAGPDLIIGESGVMNLNHRWTRVTLDNFYVDPVVVATTNTRDGSAPLTLRVRNVETNSFEIQIDEWDYLNGLHVYEQVSYVVMEAGIHYLPNGQMVLAGNLDHVTSNWNNLVFNESFADEAVPVVFAQTITTEDGSPVTTRIRGVNDDGFQIRLQEEEAADGKHDDETVSWIAIQNTTGTFGGLPFDAGVIDRVNQIPETIEFNYGFDEAPVVLAAMQSFRGSDPATVRGLGVTQDEFTVYVEEERSANKEIRHTKEAVGYLALPGGEIIGESRIAEAGIIRNLTDQWQTVTLAQTYNNPVVVAGLITLDDPDPSTIRIRNVTQNSFDIQVDEWDFYDRIHAGEDIAYLVAEAGIHQLGNGMKLVANATESNHMWTSVDFDYDFANNPVVLSQVTTENGPASATSRLQNIDTSGFDVRIQEQEGADGTHSPEAISWIALDVGFGDSGDKTIDSFLFDSVDHNEVVVPFNMTFDKIPLVFGQLQTFNDPDPVSLRQTAAGGTTQSVAVFAEEEISWDPETDHELERAGIVALEAGLLPGVTLDLFETGNLDGGFAPPSSQLSVTSDHHPYLHVAVPRVAYVDQGPVFEETSMRLAEAHEVLGGPDHHAAELDSEFHRDHGTPLTAASQLAFATTAEPGIRVEAREYLDGPVLIAEASDEVKPVELLPRNPQADEVRLFEYDESELLSVLDQDRQQSEIEAELRQIFASPA